MHLLQGSKGTCVEGYTDADYARDMDKRRSTSGYVFMFTGGAMSCDLGCKIVHQCQLLKRSILQRQRHARNLYGLPVNKRLGYYC